MPFPPHLSACVFTSAPIADMRCKAVTNTLRSRGAFYTLEHALHIMRRIDELLLTADATDGAELGAAQALLRDDAYVVACLK